MFGTDYCKVNQFYGEGNGNPLQYSCLENPVEREAWWAAVHGVTQSQIQLKQCMHACKPVFFLILFYYLTLQYCIGFAIYQHESATGIYVFPILNPPPSSLPYHPSGSSQCTSPKHPVSCIKPGLVTRFIYDIIHVSMLSSQIIPPSPSPTESKPVL